MPYVLWIAWRYLIARARQTALTVSGVALGVTIVTMMQSYMGGFLNFFIERAYQSTPSVTVTQRSKGLPNPAGPVQRALGSLGNPPVIAVAQLPVPDEREELKNPRQAENIIGRIPAVVVTSPFIDGQGIILNSDISEPVSFVGVRPLQEARVTDFQKNIIRGTPVDLAQQGNGIILGTILADNLRVQIGDRVTLISQEGISRRFLVVGIYSAEIREVDQVRAYMNLRQAQLLMDMRGISGIGVRTTSLDIALPVAQEIEKETDYTAESWREVNANTLNLFTTISMIVYLIVGLTMLVAGFGIANTLILTVNEKTKDIGILKAIGVPAQRITLLFLCVGILIGILGVVIGELLGMTGIAILARTPLPFQPTGQFSAPGEAQTFPVLRTPRVFIVSGAFGLLISFFSGVMPSLRAAKSDPIQVIREAE